MFTLFIDPDAYVPMVDYRCQREKIWYETHESWGLMGLDRRSRVHVLYRHREGIQFRKVPVTLVERPGFTIDFTSKDSLIIPNLHMSQRPELRTRCIPRPTSDPTLLFRCPTVNMGLLSFLSDGPTLWQQTLTCLTLLILRGHVLRNLLLT